MLFISETLFPTWIFEKAVKMAAFNRWTVFWDLGISAALFFIEGYFYFGMIPRKHKVQLPIILEI